MLKGENQHQVAYLVFVRFPLPFSCLNELQSRKEGALARNSKLEGGCFQF